jgi:protease-4
MFRCFVGLAILSCTGCFNGLALTPVNVGGPVEETVIAESKGFFCRDKIAVIDVEGLLVNAKKSGLMSDGENPVSLFRERLDKAATDPDVKAVVLRINSPGGAVTASDIMYQDLLFFRHDTNKPVVACMMDVAASGGYYLAMGCDQVYAHPSTVTGSIGVIMSMYNASGLTRLVGITSDAIKSGPNKDIGNPLRPMTDSEREILQGMVNSFYDQFVKIVATGRHLPEERVRALADGRVYTGEDAARLGLVDKIGYFEDALLAARNLAGVRDATVVAYDRGGGYRGSFYATAPRTPSEINVKLDIPGFSAANGTAGFMYLWEPGVPR